MKAKKEEKKVFQPIVITIETREEAENLWHSLNISTWCFENYYQHNYVPPDDVRTDMWNTFNKVFNPDKEK